MTVTFHVLWVLCALGSVALAAAPGRAPWTPWATQIAVGLGLAAGAWWLGPRDVPDVEWVGLTALAIAATRLAHPTSLRAMIVAAFAAGILSAVWMSVLRIAGVPLWAAVAVAAAPPMAAAYLTPTNPRFAPAIVRDEALLITMTLGLAVAAAPRIADGWRSAILLNIQDGSRALVLPVWTVALAAVAMAAGGAYSVWRRG
jgi:hypothetical protein